MPPKPDAATVARDEQTLERIEQQTLARHHADEDAYLMQCGCGLEAGEDVEGGRPPSALLIPTPTCGRSFTRLPWQPRTCEALS
jgi:hypothetical protein